MFRGDRRLILPKVEDMRFFKNKKGFTLIELLVSMMVLAILGAMVTALVRTGLSSSGRIATDMAQETEARTAMSLVTVQIRKHDETGAIRMGSSDVTFRDYPGSSGRKIWFEDGALKLQEYTMVSDETTNVYPQPLRIAEVLDFSVTTPDDLVPGGTATYTITIVYEGGMGESRTLTQSVTQRSDYEG
jgi:prepilin-type N-terminal cleavage/methylation domain-containing protein